MVCCKCCQGYATLCRIFTHAWMIGGVVLSIAALGSCEFVTRGELTIGLFRVKAPLSECMPYRDLEEISYGWLYDWARTSSLIAPICGALIVGLMLLDCCCNICCSKYMQTFLVVCCWLNQGFTFLIYASNACLRRQETDKLIAFCQMGDGTWLSIFAFWCYFIGGFFLCCSPKPDPYCNKQEESNDQKKKCCCRKDKDQNDNAQTKADEENAAEPKVEAKEDGPAVVPVPVVVKEEEEKEEEKEDTQQTKDNEEMKEEQTTRAVGEEKEKEQTTRDVEETKEEQTTEDTPDEENPTAAAAVVEEETPEEEEVFSSAVDAEAPPAEDESPVIVPVPVVIPAVVPRSQTPPPEEEGMEIEIDEEFGTSQVRYNPN
mmetsp:Transcript_12488/g.26580  ORF Transcript_12488/g.26580 Transcript_12488/m.26580 type:complete len:374 (-) Transcript_12488:140-1261(-)